MPASSTISVPTASTSFELVMAFEEEFGVEIPDDAAEKITTVGDATRYIEEHKG